MNILILGNHRNALAVARSLGDQHHIILAPASGVGRVERCRFVAEILSLPEASDQDFAVELEAALQGMSDPPLLFPMGDNELFGLLRVPSILNATVKAVMPNPEVVAKCLEKSAILDLANTLKIPQAIYRKVHRLAGIQEAVREIGCPCIIKSDHQLSLAFGKKAYRVDDPDKLTSLISRQSEPKHGLIVQALASGLRHNVYFAADSGHLAGAMQAKVLRTDMFDGSGFTVESQSIRLRDDLKNYTERLIESLGFHGIGNTQFLVDQQSGAISFLEISPRMGAAFAVTVPCGFDFARAGLNLAIGDPLPPEYLPANYPEGKRLVWSFGDVSGLTRATRAKEISITEAFGWLWRAIQAALTADIHTTWSWRDPKPAIANMFTLLAGAWRLVRKPIGGKGGP
jgi:predicted ATP-grasp superfamily ATP-dependent carboligase